MDGNFGHLFEIARIQSEVNRLFDVLLKDQGAEGEGLQPWLPSIDVCETEDAVVVRCELPGVSLDSLKVNTRGTDLTIAGEKAGGRPADEAKYHCVERASGAFRRVVHLPPTINTRDAEASLENGVLTVHFPKVSNRRGEEVVIPVKEETPVGTP
jgi:HSP20 family protein